jgi:hypothetical protein
VKVYEVRSRIDALGALPGDIVVVRSDHPLPVNVCRIQGPDALGIISQALAAGQLTALPSPGAGTDGEGSPFELPCPLPQRTGTEPRLRILR